jgi:hypothetical protein
MQTEKGIVASLGIDVLPTPALGDLSLGGVAVYGLACGFIALDKHPLVALTSFGFGDVIDLSNSELEGQFFGNPKNYMGRCHYTLKEFDVEAGLLELTIRHREGGEPIGRFQGPSEGFGEAYVTNKKGHLSVETKEHDNRVEIKGDSGTGIKDLQFQLEDECIADGQPYDGVDACYTSKTTKHELTIDVKCGRNDKYGKTAAQFFNDGIGNDANHLVGDPTDTRTARHLPFKVNFAIRGTLSIDGTDYDVCFAQYHSGAFNPWFFGSRSLVGDPRKMTDGTLGGAYAVKASGYSSFKITRLVSARVDIFTGA